MIKSFKDKRTADLARGVTPRRLAEDVAARAVVKLFQLDTVTRVEDLRVPPGNELERMNGDRAGQYSIRVNRQWRVCFRWRDGHAYDAEFVDYH